MRCIQYHDLEDGMKLEIKVRYDLGGRSYLSGQYSRRGYYIHFTKCNIIDRDGYKMKESSMFSDDNFKILAKEVKRKSARIEEQVRFFVLAMHNVMHEMYVANNRQGILDLVKENVR